MGRQITWKLNISSAEAFMMLQIWKERETISLWATEDTNTSTNLLNLAYNRGASSWAKWTASKQDVLIGGSRLAHIIALASTGQGLERDTHKATFCYLGWKATGQGPVISRGCAVGKEQRSKEWMLALLDETMYEFTLCLSVSSGGMRLGSWWGLEVTMS